MIPIVKHKTVVHKKIPNSKTTENIIKQGERQTIYEQDDNKGNTIINTIAG